MRYNDDSFWVWLRDKLIFLAVIAIIVGIAWLIYSNTLSARSDRFLDEVSEYHRSTEQQAADKAYALARQKGWLTAADWSHQEMRDLRAGKKDASPHRVLWAIKVDIGREVQSRLEKRGITQDHPDYRRLAQEELKPVQSCLDLYDVENDLLGVMSGPLWRRMFDAEYKEEALERDREKFAQLKAKMNQLLADE